MQYRGSLPERPKQPEPVKQPLAQAPQSVVPVQSKRSYLKKIVIPVLLVGLLLVGVFATWNTFSSASLIDKGRYQAVFLENGQVYFGKLHKEDDEYFKLTDIYYLQSSAGLQSADGGGASAGTALEADATQQLIKLGKEIHGPQDEMILHKLQILFFENITEEGTVGQAINNDKRQKQ